MTERNTQNLGLVDIENGAPAPLPGDGRGVRLPAGAVDVGPLGPRIIRPLARPQHEDGPDHEYPVTFAALLARSVDGGIGDDPGAADRVTGEAAEGELAPTIVLVVVRAGERRARLGEEAVAMLRGRGIPARGPLTWPQEAMDEVQRAGEERPEARMLVIGVDETAAEAGDLSREIAATLASAGPLGPRIIKPYGRAALVGGDDCPPVDDLSPYVVIFAIVTPGTPDDVLECLRQEIGKQRRSLNGVLPMTGIDRFLAVWRSPNASVIAFVLAETWEKAGKAADCVNDCAGTGEPDCDC
ncbi:MAG: hypothetical protein ACKOWF_17300 [Chloroflexota bacterium]